MATREFAPEPGPPALRLSSRQSVPHADGAVVELKSAADQTAEANANADALERAWQEVQRLEAAYEQSFERAMRQRETREITTAFDEADRLQERLMRACRRFRKLREDSPPSPTPPDQAS